MRWLFEVCFSASGRRFLYGMPLVSVGDMEEVTLPCDAVPVAVPWLLGALSGLAVDAAAAGMGAV